MLDTRVILTDELAPLESEHYKALWSLGVDRNTADAAHLKLIAHSEAMRLCGCTQREIEVSTTEIGSPAFGNYEGIHIPYVHPATREVYGWCIRRSKPLHEVKGGGLLERRLLRSHRGMYFVPGTEQASLMNPSIPVVFAVGELMALAWWRFCRITNSNMIPVGLQDHTSYLSWSRDLQGTSKTIAEFESIIWEGRRVFLALPPAGNPATGTVLRLIEELVMRKAMVEESLLLLNPPFYWHPSVMPRLPHDMFHFDVNRPEILTCSWK